MEKREIIAELAELFASVPGNVLSREDRIKSKYDIIHPVTPPAGGDRVSAF